MSEKILVFAPKFDTATEYSSAWAQSFIDKIKNDPYVNYSSLLENDAIKRNFDAIMPYHDELIFFDHGNKDGLVGNDSRMIVTKISVGKLTGKRVFAMACLSALELGALAYHSGCLEYWGATDVIGFTLADADLFGEVYVEGAYQRFVEDKPIDEVMINMKNHFDTQKDKTLNPWTKIWLEKDKDIWVCWYCDNPPEKPKELTWWEKLIKFIINFLESIGILERDFGTGSIVWIFFV